MHRTERPGRSRRDRDGTRAVPLARTRVTIGRSRESDIFLPDQWLSRHHAEIRSSDAASSSLDLGSKNGTLLNGEPVRGERRLRHGDVITLGEHVLTFSIEARPRQRRGRREPPEGTRIFSAKRAVRHRDQARPSTPRSCPPEPRAGVLSQAARELLAHRPLPELFEDDPEPAVRGRARRARRHPAPRGPATRDRRIKASRSRARPAAHREVSRSIARRVTGAAATLLLPNVLEDAALQHAGQHPLHRHPLRAVRAAVVHLAAAGTQDDVIGLVYLDSLKDYHSFTEEDLRIVTALANVAAAKIENVRLLEESMEKRRLEEDMRVAAEIQRGLLPASAPDVAGLRRRRLATAPAAPSAATTTTSAPTSAACWCSRSATSPARARAPRCS